MTFDVASIVKIFIFLAVFTLFAVELSDLAYLFWLLSWFLASIFSVFCYLGASSSSVAVISWLFVSFLLAGLLLKLYKILFSS